MKNKMEGPLNQTKPIRQMAENINQFVQKPEEALGVERAHGEPFYTPLGLTHAIGNYFTGGELGALTKAGDLIPLAAKTIPYVGKHLPGLIDRAAIGAGAELNEEQPSMRGAIEKSLISMLLPPAVSAVAGAIRNPIKTGNSLADSIINTFDKLTPSKTANKLKTGLEQETNKIKQNAENQALYIENNNEKQINQINDDVNKTAKNVATELHKGNNTQELAKDIANDIRPLHDMGQANASAYYDYALNAADRERKIGIDKNQQDRGLVFSKKINPLISTSLDEGIELKNIAKKDFGEIGKLFSDEPTLRNTHNLRQEVGIKAADIRSIPRPKRTPEQNLELQNYDSMYGQLTDAMKNYMKNLHPNKNENLLPQWEKGEEIWQQQVKPFLYDSKLRNIVRPTRPGGGRKESVKNIHEAFANPETHDIRSPSGELIQGDANKLLQMLPQETKDKILALQMKAPKGENIEELNRKFNIAENGYSHLIRPDLKKSINEALLKQQEAKRLEQLSKEHIRELKSKSQSQIESIKNKTEPLIKELNKKQKNIYRTGAGLIGLSGAGLAGKTAYNLFKYITGE